MSMPKPRLAAVAAMLGLVVATTPTVAGATPDRPAQATPILEAASVPDRVEGEPPSRAVRSRFVELSDAGLSGLGSGAAVSFEVFPREVLTGTVDAVSRDAAATSWNGSLDDGGSWFAARVDDTFHISLQSAEGGFEVSSAGDHTYRVVETEAPELHGNDQVKQPASPEADESTSGAVKAPSGAAARAASPAARPETAAADAGNVVDILFVVTARARAEAGSDAAIAAQVATGVSQMNTAMQRSGVPGQVRQAGLAYTGTTEVGGNLDLDLDRVRIPGDGFFDEAQPNREVVHADIVSLWIGGEPGDYCGLGYLPRDERGAFHALYRSCATDPLTYTFAHEAGHNFRLSHDAGASEAPSSTSAPYARGYVDVAAKFFTIMAYPTQCYLAGVSCTLLLNYSNPAVLQSGRPTGTSAANNALAMTEQFPTVANFRKERIYGVAPTITGDARFGGRLVAEPGVWEPVETTSLAYQWFADGAPMEGRVGRSLDVTKWMIGRTLTVQVTGIAPYYTPLALGSAATAPVARALFRKRKAVLKGKPRVGRVLKVETKIRPKAKKVTYQWYRGNKRIKGAKKATYRLRRADRGKKVSVMVKARKKGYVTLKKRTNKRKIR